ncbi:uncharacterized protein LOC102807979, partial [Saccoglossus kowalevskii]|uniref:Uncharacterized protein LOC102807979 n=1 Tax=Saccoglossus kowalevskii TaxID=10224 RepID=A0ABM0MJJ2_SACKO
PVPAVRYVQNSDSEYAQIVDGQIYETLSRATASQGLANMAYQHEDAPPPYTARDDGGNAAVQNNKQFSCVPEINNGYALPTPVMHSHYEEPYSKKKLENSPKNEKEKKTFVDLPSEDVNRSTTEI